MTEQQAPIVIDVVSDIVCPWCFIGKRRLEKAVALRPSIPVEIRYRPYFLNEWVPRDGMPRADYLKTKFGSVERYNDIAERVRENAAAEGLVYAPDKINRQPNTIDAHQLIFWAGLDKAAILKQRLMDLYFTEGADLSDRNILIQAAVDAGMNRQDVTAALESDMDTDRITREANAAKEAGIEGVPLFIFGGVLAVSGAQSPEYLADVLDRVCAQREQSTIKPTATT